MQMFRLPSCLRLPTLLVTRLNILEIIAHTSSLTGKYIPENKNDSKSERLNNTVCDNNSQADDESEKHKILSEQTDGDSSISSVLKTRSVAILVDYCSGLSKNYWSTGIKLSSAPKKKAIPNLYSTSPVSLIANSSPIDLYHGSIVDETSLWGNLNGKSTSKEYFNTTRYRMKTPKIYSYREGNNDLTAKLTDAKEKLVIIDFFSKWCASCDLIASYIEELKNEFPNVVIIKVDVDDCEEAALEYNVKSMPTFVFVKCQVEIDRFSGANKDKLKETLRRNK